MPIPSSGSVSLGDLQTEFGGANPASLSEYYGNGAYVLAGTAGDSGTIPSSGEISLGDFRGVPTTYLNDNFVDTDGTAITNHDPDYDYFKNGWTGTGEIDTSQGDASVFTNGEANLDAYHEGKIEFRGGVQVSGLGDGLRVRFNYQSDSYKWQTGVQQGPGVTTFYIWEFVNTTFSPTNRASDTTGPNALDVDTFGEVILRLEIDGDTVSSNWFNTSMTAQGAGGISYTGSPRGLKTETVIGLGADSDNYYNYLRMYPLSHTGW